MRCTVEVFEHSSAVLRDNPLGDPSERELAVILPPSYSDRKDARYPVILALTGYTGVGLQLLNRSPWSEPLDRRMARLVREGRAKEAIIVLPDCFTRYGGSQYVDSPAVGRYETYLVEEVLPLIDARYRTIPEREARAVMGKSSGGYGAMILTLRRPDVFGAFASHAGDAAFDLSYGAEFPATLLMIEKHGGIMGFLAWFETLPSKPSPAVETLSNILAAACWSPSASGPYGYGTGFDLPFDAYSCARIESVWRRWLNWDPAVLVDQPEYLDAWRSMSAIYLDGGLTDEYNLQLAARQIKKKLERAQIPVVHEEFDGGHFNVQFRYDRSLEVMTQAIAQTS